MRWVLSDNKGLDKFTHYHLIGGLILAFGIIILLYFLYEMLAKNQGRTLRLLVHVFEGVGLLFTLYIFFEESKKYLPYITLAASIGFFVSVLVICIQTKRPTDEGIMHKFKPNNFWPLIKDKNHGWRNSCI
jgi:hypothetical protein